MIHLSLSIQNVNKNVTNRNTFFFENTWLLATYIHKITAEIGETGATLRVHSRWQDSTLYCCKWKCNEHEGWGETMSCIEDGPRPPHPVSSLKNMFKTHPWCGIGCWPEAEDWIPCFWISASFSAVIGCLETSVVTVHLWRLDSGE